MTEAIPTYPWVGGPKSTHLGLLQERCMDSSNTCSSWLVLPGFHFAAQLSPTLLQCSNMSKIDNPLSKQGGGRWGVAL